MIPLVSVNLVVRNGEKYVRGCLSAVLNQTYGNLELTVFDNNSTDGTKEIVRKEFPRFRLIENNVNYNFGTGQNRCAGLTKGEYILGLCVDVFLDKDFIKNAVAVMEADKKIGALQAKIYKMACDLEATPPSRKNECRKTNIIDTAGFEIYRSRRIVNRGHGEEDKGQFNKSEEIFSYEGACPFFRRAALEDAAVPSSAADGHKEFHDEDFWWYADDIDLGWRLRLFGWKSFFAPDVIAYHDRSTTKRLSKGYRDFVKMRRELPALKKRLDWQNTQLTLLKNDICANVLKDFFPFFRRQFSLFVYFLIFEQSTLPAIPKILLMLPRMLKKRRYIIKYKRASAEEMERWFR
ncbi:MAG: glycosyltransferase family 2 protein [Patescibacteria group bacterium]